MSSSPGTDAWHEPQRRLEDQAHRILRWQWLLMAAVVVAFVVGYFEDQSRRHLAEHNCAALHGLAQIEKRYIARQEAQAQELLVKDHLTLGIPATRIPELLQHSQESESTFLAELSALAAANC